MTDATTRENEPDHTAIESHVRRHGIPRPGDTIQVRANESYLRMGRCWIVVEVKVVEVASILRDGKTHHRITYEGPPGSYTSVGVWDHELPREG